MGLIIREVRIDGAPAIQRRGFSITAVHRDALERSRELKPEIPLLGIDGIPLRDEIVLEMRL
jgi:hypothetical protein